MDERCTSMVERFSKEDISNEEIADVSMCDSSPTQSLLHHNIVCDKGLNWRRNAELDVAPVSQKTTLLMKDDEIFDINSPNSQNQFQIRSINGSNGESERMTYRNTNSIRNSSSTTSRALQNVTSGQVLLRPRNSESNIFVAEFPVHSPSHARTQEKENYGSNGGNFSKSNGINRSVRKALASLGNILGDSNANRHTTPAKITSPILASDAASAIKELAFLSVPEATSDKERNMNPEDDGPLAWVSSIAAEDKDVRSPITEQSEEDFLPSEMKAKLSNVSGSGDDYDIHKQFGCGHYDMSPMRECLVEEAPDSNLQRNARYDSQECSSTVGIEVMMTQQENNIPTPVSAKLEELDELRRKLDSERKNTSEALAELKAAHEDELDALRQQLASERDSSSRKLADIQSLHDKELFGLNQKLNSMQCARESEELDWSKRESELKEEIKTLQRCVDDERQRVQEGKCVQKELEEQLLSHEEQITEQQNRISSLEQTLQSQKHISQVQMQQIEDTHTAEIDEMISQLDDVVKDHDLKLKTLQSQIDQKECIIHALGSQLAEANQNIRNMDTKHLEYQRQIEQALISNEDLQQSLSSANSKIQALHMESVKFKEEEAKIRKQVVEKTKHEMRVSAEQQFNEANRYYLKLKNEYDQTVAHLHDKNRMLEEHDKKIDALNKEKKGIEVTLKAELAQVKASLANAEANMARLNQDFSNELDRMKDKENRLMKDREGAVNNLNAAHQSLAALVAAKEKLENENKELKSVCEELMAMVEGEGNGT